MSWSLIVLALVAGAVIPFQGAANSRFGAVAGHPAWGAFWNIVVALLISGLYLLIARPGQVGRVFSGDLPVWAWFGGAFGVVYLVGLTALLPRLGPSLTLGLIVLGQSVAATLIERFGWLGLPSQPLGASRLLAIGFLVLGVVLLRR